MISFSFLCDVANVEDADKEVEKTRHAVFSRFVANFVVAEPQRKIERRVVFQGNSIVAFNGENYCFWFNLNSVQDISFLGSFFCGLCSPRTACLSADGNFLAFAKENSVLVVNKDSLNLLGTICLPATIAGFGFTNLNGDLFFCLSDGRCFHSSKERCFSQSAFNLSLKTNKSIEFCCLVGAKMFAISGFELSVFVLDERASLAPRVIPFQNIAFGVPPNLTFVNSLRDSIRKFLEVASLKERDSILSMSTNGGSIVAFLSRKQVIYVLDLDSGVYRSKSNVLSFSWFSPSTLAYIDSQNGELVVADLFFNILMKERGLLFQDLCFFRDRELILLENRLKVQLYRAKECSIQEILNLKLINGEFTEAISFCLSHNISQDIVHQKIFETSPISADTIDNHLAKVSDHKWVLNICLHRVPFDLSSTVALLNFGLNLTIAENLVFERLQFEREFERLEAYNRVFSHFNSDMFRIFRECETVNDVGRYLARESFVLELQTLLFDTSWGKKDGNPSLVINFIPETVSPLLFAELFRNLDENDLWFLHRAWEVDLRTGLIEHSIEILTFGLAKFPQSELLQGALRDAQQLIRLVFEFQVDFSLSLKTWQNMSKLDKLRVCYHDDIQFMSKRILFLFDSLTPLQLKPWMVSLQDFILQMDALPKIEVLLFESTLIHRDRLDGRLILLEISAKVLSKFESHERFFRRLDDLDERVETILPSKFAVWRDEIRNIRSRFELFRRIKLRGIPICSLKDLNETFVWKLLEEGKNNSEDEFEFIFRDALELGIFFSVSSRVIETKAVEVALLNSFHRFVCKHLDTLKQSDAENAYSCALRHWFVQGNLEAAFLTISSLSRPSFSSFVSKWTMVCNVGNMLKNFLSPFEVLLLVEKQDLLSMLAELLKQKVPFSIVLEVAERFGENPSTIASTLVIDFLLRHSEFEAARTLTKDLLCRSTANRRDIFLACNAISKFDPQFQLEALLHADGVDLTTSLDEFLLVSPQISVEWLKFPLKWQRACGSSFIGANLDFEFLSLFHGVKSEVECIALLDAFEIRRGNFDPLTRNPFRILDLFPEISQETLFQKLSLSVQESHSERFKTISQQLFIPDSSLRGCVDLGFELSDEFVLLFFKALKSKKLQGLTPTTHEQYAYAVHKLTLVWFEDVLFHLQLLAALCPFNPSDLVKRLNSVASILSLKQNVDFARLGMGYPNISGNFQKSTVDRDLALRYISECLVGCNVPIDFSFAVTQISDLDVSQSEILLSFIVFVLGIWDEKESNFINIWAPSIYEKQCKILVPKLEDGEIFELARRAVFSVEKIPKETRISIFQDCMNCSRKASWLMPLLDISFPKSLSHAFNSCGISNTIQNEFVFRHVHDLEWNVLETLAQVFDFDLNVMLVKAFSSGMVNKKPSFELPRVVLQKLETTHIDILVDLGVVSLQRKSEVEIKQLAAQQGWDMNMSDWFLFQGVQNSQSSFVALRILFLLSFPVDEAILTRLVLQLNSIEDMRVCIETFPPLKQPDILFHGLLPIFPDLAFDFGLQKENFESCRQAILQVVHLFRGDFLLLFDRFGHQVLDVVETSVLMSNSESFSSSCCRFALELICKRHDLSAANIFVCKHKRMPFSCATNVLCSYFKHVLNGIQSNLSMLRFQSYEERIQALILLSDALTLCCAVVHEVVPEKRFSDTEDVLLILQTQSKKKILATGDWDEDNLNFEDKELVAKRVEKELSRSSAQSDPLEFLLSPKSTRIKGKHSNTEIKTQDSLVDSSLTFLMEGGDQHGKRFLKSKKDKA